MKVLNSFINQSIKHSTEHMIFNYAMGQCLTSYVVLNQKFSISFRILLFCLLLLLETTMIRFTNYIKQYLIKKIKEI